MARALSNCTSISSFLFDGISTYIQRRVYATATIAEAVKQNHKVEEKVSSLSTFTGGNGLRGSNSQKESAGWWIPDSITGYYRPANYVDNVDVAELRKTHHG